MSNHSLNTPSPNIESTFLTTLDSNLYKENEPPLIPKRPIDSPPEYNVTPWASCSTTQLSTDNSGYIFPIS